MVGLGLLATWGSTPEERSERYGCDDVVAEPHVVAWRAVDVAAPKALVFRWVCQLRVAPYSYDLIDNLGRRSPRRLTPGLDALELGQRFMTVFTLVGVDPGTAITLETRHQLLGHVACTYRVTPGEGGTSRLVVKLVAAAASRLGAVGRATLRVLLPGGDLVMMRRQLLTLKTLAERDARTPAGDIVRA